MSAHAMQMHHRSGAAGDRKQEDCRWGGRDRKRSTRAGVAKMILDDELHVFQERHRRDRAQPDVLILLETVTSVPARALPRWPGASVPRWTGCRGVDWIAFGLTPEDEKPDAESMLCRRGLGRRIAKSSSTTSTVIRSSVNHHRRRATNFGARAPAPIRRRTVRPGRPRHRPGSGEAERMACLGPCSACCAYDRRTPMPTRHSQADPGELEPDQRVARAGYHSSPFSPMISQPISALAAGPRRWTLASKTTRAGRMSVSMRASSTGWGSRSRTAGPRRRRSGGVIVIERTRSADLAPRSLRSSRKLQVVAQDQPILVRHRPARPVRDGPMASDFLRPARDAATHGAQGKAIRVTAGHGTLDVATRAKISTRWS